MDKFFNTAGPCQSDIHYVLPPLARVNLPELEGLIAGRKYFVLHAPRQTGKTTCLLALEQHLNRRGEFRALYANVEAAQAAREDVADAMRAILATLAERAHRILGDPYPREHFREALEGSGGNGALNTLLGKWAAHSGRPLVLLLDEVDALIGDRNSPAANPGWSTPWPRRRASRWRAASIVPKRSPPRSSTRRRRT